MERVAAAEQGERAARSFRRVNEGLVAVEESFQADEVHIPSAAHLGHEDELAAGFARLDQQRDGEVVDVEVPGQAVARLVRDDVQRLELVGHAVKPFAAFDGSDEIGQRLPFVDAADQGVADLVVGELERSLAEEAVGRVVGGFRRIALVEQRRPQVDFR